MKFTAWVLRPIVLFAATYTIVTVLHELTHALTAKTTIDNQTNARVALARLRAVVGSGFSSETDGARDCFHSISFKTLTIKFPATRLRPF